MYVDVHAHPEAVGGDALHRVAVSLTAGAFLLAVGLAAVALSLWHGARHLALRLTHG
jgi:hypothetical protein